MNNKYNDEDNNEGWPYKVCHGIVTIIGGCIILCVFRWIFINAANFATKISTSPIFVFGLFAIIEGIVELLKGLNLRKGMTDDSVSAESVFDKDEKLNLADKIISKLVIVVFLLFWFGFLTVASYYVIKDGDMIFLAFTLPFWCAGIGIAIHYLK